MVIKNKKKFLRIFFIIISSIICINLFLPKKTLSYQPLNYKNVSVLNGDTLWTIAKTEQLENSYYQGKDIRDIIQNIKEVNNLNSTNLKINQVLNIPTY